MAKLLSEATATRLIRLLNGKSLESAHGGHASGGGRLKFVKCLSATAVGGDAILDECYPAVLLRPASDYATPPEEADIGVLLTVVGDDGESVAPVEGRVYLCLLTGEVESDRDESEDDEEIGGRMRAFGVPIPNADASSGDDGGSGSGGGTGNEWVAGLRQEHCLKLTPLSASGACGDTISDPIWLTSADGVTWSSVEGEFVTVRDRPYQAQFVKGTNCNGPCFSLLGTPEVEVACCDEDFEETVDAIVTIGIDSQHGGTKYVGTLTKDGDVWTGELDTEECVLADELAVEADVDPTSGEITETTNQAFFYTATPTGGVRPFTYAWDFDGGDVTFFFFTSATSQNPVVTYAAAGSYTATVTITDACGNTAMASAPDVIVSAPGVGCESYVTNVSATVLNRTGSMSWAGTGWTLTTDGAGNWTAMFSDDGCTWTASSWDGSGMKTFNKTGGGFDCTDPIIVTCND